MQKMLVLGVCAASVVMGSSVLAEEQFVGRWAAAPAICSMRGGDSPANSALVATDTSLWWYDGYCRIGKMYKAKAVYVQAHCGEKGDVAVTLDAQGNRMHVTWGKSKPEDLKRCN